MKAQTNLKQKFVLVFSSFVFLLFTLKIIFRLGGFVLLSKRDHHFRQSLSQQGVIRILCLGESTTYMGEQNAFPRQLEALLNQKSRKTFFVINGGVASITSEGIVADLKSNILRYRPDIVIVMMGINDDEKTKPFRDSFQTYAGLFIKNIRVVKFAELIWKHLRYKLMEIRASAQSGQELLKRTKGNEYENYLRMKIVDRPRESWGYRELRVYYEKRGQLLQAEKIYFQAMLSNPKKEFGYDILRQFLLRQKRATEAESYLNKAMRRNPTKYWPHRLWGHYYTSIADYEKAQESYQKAIEMSFDRSTSEAAPLYRDLALMLEKRGHCKQAGEILKKACSIQADIFSQDILKQCYPNQSLSVRRKDFRQDTLEFPVRKIEYKQATVDNYRLLAEILNDHYIQLIAMQYPMVELHGLREALKDVPVFAFAGNIDRFQRFLNKDGFDEYFTDRFGGTFGHCSTQGNRLIAENLVEIILDRLSQQGNP